MNILDKVKPVRSALISTAIDIPLVVTLTLDWCTKRMMNDQVMVRKISACEIMGSVNVICTGKTGTLTMNQMEVTKCCIGLDHTEKEFSGLIDPKVLELFHQGVGLNTTGSVLGATPEYIGSPTEKALLSWAVMDLDMDMVKLKQDSPILHLETFDSKKKCSGVYVEKKDDKTVHVHWKGAAEMVLVTCSHYYQKNGVMKFIISEEREHLDKMIQGMAASGLRFIAFAHKQKHNEDDTNFKTLKEKGLTLLGIVGIKDPCRPEAKEAIDACRSGGVEIKMITGDNIFTAKAIATNCGILNFNEQGSEDEVITGEEFRNYTDDERMKKVDNIRIMARSAPLDKLLMVDCLKRKGRVVVLTDHDSNDAPTLKEVDIGISMGIHGTEVAKESSDIVILDDSFASIANSFKWGRCAFNNIQKFVQFQLTVNIVALVINFVAVVFDSEAPLTVVQLLWVNFIMDQLGDLALSSERPTKELMHNPPVARGTPLLTSTLCRNISAQAIYQIVILLTFHFKGMSFLNVNEGVKNTIIFNTFVLCQVSSLFNSRTLEKKNIFEGLHKNWLYLGIIGVIVIIQVLMVEYLNSSANTEKLNRKQWGLCLGVAVISGLIGCFVKFIQVPHTPFLTRHCPYLNTNNIVVVMVLIIWIWLFVIVVLMLFGLIKNLTLVCD